jgi:hypothetical protein
MEVQLMTLQFVAGWEPLTLRNDMFAKAYQLAFPRFVCDESICYKHQSLTELNRDIERFPAVL